MGIEFFIWGLLGCFAIGNLRISNRNKKLNVSNYLFQRRFLIRNVTKNSLVSEISKDENTLTRELLLAIFGSNERWGL